MWFLLCSIVWGERWCFVMLTFVELLTINCLIFSLPICDFKRKWIQRTFFFISNRTTQKWLYGANRFYILMILFAFKICMVLRISLSDFILCRYTSTFNQVVKSIFLNLSTKNCTRMIYEYFMFLCQLVIKIDGCHQET